MTKPTVYEANAYLYGFPELFGKSCRLFYLETERSRKWKKSSCWVFVLSEFHINRARKLMDQEGWYSIKFERE